MKKIENLEFTSFFKVKTYRKKTLREEFKPIIAFEKEFEKQIVKTNGFLWQLLNPKTPLQ